MKILQVTLSLSPVDSEKYLRFQVRAHIRAKMLVVFQGNYGMLTHWGMSAPHLLLPPSPSTLGFHSSVYSPSDTLSCLSYPCLLRQHPGFSHLVALHCSLYPPSNQGIDTIMSLFAQASVAFHSPQNSSEACAAIHSLALLSFSTVSSAPPPSLLPLGGPHTTLSWAY